MKNLGPVVTELNRCFDIPEVDERLARYGDCSGLLHAGLLRQADRIARAHGFRDLEHVSREVVRRTSTRWAHFHLRF